MGIIIIVAIAKIKASVTAMSFNDKNTTGDVYFNEKP